MEGKSGILDTPVREREAFIEKCAEVAYSYNTQAVFAIRQKSCYLIKPYLSQATLHEHTKSHDCISIDPNSGGTGFDVYGFLPGKKLVFVKVPTFFKSSNF